LGLLLARELARQGCRVAICARDGRELERARESLAARGAEAVAVRCDVTRPDEVRGMVAEVEARLGPVDVLVNNAGIIVAGPVTSMSLEDFQLVMATDFWGTLHPTLAVLPSMLARGQGRIVNVTSIGGRVSMPHLVPYGCAKFAAVGLSEGLRAELSRDGIVVTTVAPGLMRTGSFLNARFRGNVRAEYVWFSLSDSLPLVSMDAERAARRIILAARRGESQVTLTAAANVLARMHGLMPGVTADLLGLANRLLPRGEPSPSGAPSVRGMEIHAGIQSRLLRSALGLGLSAARRFHEYPGPSHEDSTQGP
ncbi:MAG: SDR family oxidoreductase, partial [Gemmatimonadetes bacterium]|nr:SDR family oxidoreductase [Gemmatimonadota bacterium]